MRALAVAGAVVGGLLAGCGGDEASPPPADRPLRPLALALDFQPNAAHAGVYATVRQRLDRARGLELRIRVPSASVDSLRLLRSGRVDLGIVDIHDLGIARQRGEDLVGVGAIVQRPLAAVIAKPEVGRPRDLEGRRVGVTGLPSDDAVLRAIVEDDGGDFSKVRRTTIGFSAVPTLIAGKVDAVVAFWNAEGVALQVSGVRTREFRLSGLRSGPPRYPELVVAARRDTLDRDRRLVDDAVAALASGTRAALADRAAAVQDIARASEADERLVRAQLDAVAPALSPPLRLDRRAIEDWARFDVRYGILERPPDLERAFALDLGR